MVVTLSCSFFIILFLFRHPVAISVATSGQTECIEPLYKCNVKCFRNRVWKAQLTMNI